MVDRLPRAHWFKIDEEGSVIPCFNLLEFGQWFETSHKVRTIAKTKVQDVEVSTMFLGIPYPNLWDDNMDYLFETMVFGDQTAIDMLETHSDETVNSLFGMFLGVSEVQRRYKTLEEAKTGHEEMVEYVKRILVMRN